MKKEKISRSTFIKGVIAGAVSIVVLVALRGAFVSNDTAASASGETAATTTEVTEIAEVAEGATYAPGTYTASAQGLNGAVTVEVTFSEDAIESVVVTDHQETEGIGSNAVDQLPDKIVETQSLGIDGVSGATYTSTAIIEAVANCVTQAGGDAEALKSVKVEATAEKTEETLEADLVIVGGGGSGMTACIRATELGLDVILVEKMSYMGGAISISGGNQVVMGSQLQIDLGVTEDSVESMVEDFMANGANLNVTELVTLYAENVGETSDWLQEQGVTYDTESGLHQLAEYTYDRELAYTGGGSGAAETMRELVEASGATVLLSTQANELLTDDSGAVVGVAASSDTVDYTINADAVLLATGGYGNNDDLLTEEMQNALYYGPVSSTGDGIIMATAEGIDADTRLMEYGKRYPNGIEVSEGTAKSTINGNYKAFTMSGILVSPEGERVVSEKASNRTILEAELEQTDQMLYLLMDEETFQEFVPAVSSAGISEEDIEGYLENNGSTTPIFYHADTLEELAELAGMDADTLTATVERYNSFVQNGEDEDFGRPAEYLTMEIGDGPYYLVEQKPRFATTMGGLVVNENLEVQNTSGETIEGLYASGETVGGVMGDDSPSGANNGWAVTSGKLAAEAIAEALQ
ncbi:MAG: FAD-dependent oxidoreductase [Lachnospiraceae bacterium]|nr:FAD-dependent oxidoreductase [Lachnospiraceae bacterium]